MLLPSLLATGLLSPGKLSRDVAKSWRAVERARQFWVLRRLLRTRRV